MTEPIVFPASFAQQRMWFLQRLRPTEAHYNSHLLLDTTGHVDSDLLEAALRDVVVRHEVLRTTFTEVAGELSQVVAATPAPQPYVTVVEAGPADPGDLAVMDLVRDRIQLPFDLETGPLVRCSVLRLGPGRQLLLFCLHHIIADGWSLNLLAEELGAAYRARLAGDVWRPEPLEIQYADFADWQRDHLRGDVLDAELEHWRGRLGGPLPVLDLPTDRPRRAERSTSGGRVNFALSAELTSQVRKLCGQERVTSFMVLLAAFGTLLHRYTGQDDLVVGSPVACRESAQVKPLLGLFVNTVGLRLDLAGEPSFRDLLRRVREVCLDAFAHQDLPLDKIVDELRPPRLPGRSPLFDVLFALQNPARLDLKIPGVRTVPLEIERFTSRFDLELHFWEQTDHFTGAFVYTTDLFDARTVRRLAGHLEELLGNVVTTPDLPVSRVPLLSAQDRAALPAVPSAGEDLVTRFARSVERRPDAAALGILTFARLDELANRVAARLRELGVRQGDAVAVRLDRGPDELVSTLAVLKLGAVCVPLDTAHPAEFRRRLVSARQPRILLATGADEVLPEAVVVEGHRAAELPSAPAPDVSVPPDAAAFVVWTARGPRVLTHETVCRQLDWLRQRFTMSDEDPVRYSSSPVLARSVWERCWPLAVGGGLDLVGGADFVAPDLYEVDGVLAGPEAVYLLDGHGEPVPVGARGEICVGPPGCEPVHATRTGDFGRRKEDGGWELLTAGQWRVRGFPVDPADLAATVLGDRAVRDCVVRPAGEELVAYVVPAGPFTARQAADLVRAAWPEELVPSGYVPVSSIPADPAELDQLPVHTDDLLQKWQDVLGALPGAGRTAVVVEDVAVTDERVAIRAPRTAPAAASPVTASPVTASGTGPALSFGPELGELEVGNLTEALARASRGVHGVTYVDGDTIETQTYAELLAAASAVLTGLRQAGLRPGDKVIFQLDRNPEVVVGFWACALGGFVPVPLATPGSYDVMDAVVSKLENAHEMLEAPWLLVSGSLADGLKDLAARRHWPSVRAVVFDQVTTCAPDAVHHHADTDDPALVLLTSGSTGRPKAVVLSHRNLLSRAAGAALVQHITTTDVSFNWMPLDHVGGIQMFHVRDVLVGCAQIHAPIRWVLEDPLRWLDCADRFGVSVTWAPNFAYGLVNERAAECAERDWDLSLLRYILNAGEAISSRTARRFLRVLAPKGLPGTAMTPEWGMSETSSAVTYHPGFTLATTSDDDLFVEVGVPYPGVGLRIVDDDGALVDGDRIGRLQVSGPTVTRGYHDNPEQNAASFTDDGWFETGDLGFLRSGALTITGRVKDVVIVNGINYYSHEIEAAVEELDAVENSFTAACGVRETAGATDEIAIFFHLRAGFDEAEAIRAVRAQVISRVGVNPAHLVPVDAGDIPKTEIGKIQRAKLRDRFHDGGFAEIRARVDLLLGNERTLPNWFYRTSWRPVPVSGRWHDGDGHTVVFLDDLGLGERLCAVLPSCVQVRPGREFTRISATAYVLDPSVGDHHQRLFDSLADDGVEVDRVVDLLACAKPDSAETNRAIADGDWAAPVRLANLIRAAAGRMRSLYVVTTNAAGVHPADVLACERLPIAGFVKSVGQELPRLRCRQVDLDLETDVTVLLEEFTSAAREDQVAYREGRRWAQRLVRLGDGPAEPGFRRGGLYVVSGGLGEIGAEIAAQLLAAYDVRLLLLGRSAVETHPLLTREDVMYVQADVCDESQVRAAVDAAETRWSAPLAGVLHLAGSFAEVPVTEQTEAEFADVLAPKVRGAWVLHGLLRDRPGALFVSFSSVNGYFGGAMVSAYAAANAFLDGLAVHQRRQGIAAYSLAWSMWDELGMSRGYPLKELTRARGFHLLGRREGVHSFFAALRHDEPHVLIGMDAGTPAISAQVEQPFHPLTRLVGYLTGTVEQRELELADRYGRPSRCALVAVDELPVDEHGELDRRRLTGDLAAEGPGTDLERVVASVWSRTLDVDRVGMRDNFFELGGTSLLMTTAHRLLKEQVPREVSLVDLFRYPTPAALAAFLSTPDDAPATTRGEDRAARRLRARGRRDAER